MDGKGTIIRVFADYAFIRPDLQQEYGATVFMPCQIGQGGNEFEKIYRPGDRVKFVGVKSRNPNDKCAWVATEVCKILDSGPASIRAVYNFRNEKIIRDARGFVKCLGENGFGRICIETPFRGEAFFECPPKPTLAPFANGDPVAFDLKAHCCRGEYGWSAVSVRPIQNEKKEDKANLQAALGKLVLDPEMPKKESAFSDPFLRKAIFSESQRSSNELFPPMTKNQHQQFRPILTASRGTQTEPVEEMSILSTLMEDGRVFDYVRLRYPKLVYQWANRNGGPTK